MNATALICKQCGATIHIVENVGKLVCQSCGTEYIIDNLEGEKILKEFFFENPFKGVDRILDEDLKSIHDRMEIYNDYKNSYNELVSIEESNSYKYGYWILRLRSYTEDFKHNYDSFAPFDEINNCVEQHTRFSEFTKAEEECICEYYERSMPLLLARMDVLLRENESEEKELKKLVKEKERLTKEIDSKQYLIRSEESITENTKKEHPKLYLWKTLSIVFTSVFGALALVCLITIVLIPLGIMLSLVAIGFGISIPIIHSTVDALETAYNLRIVGQIHQIRKRIADIEKNVYSCKNDCVKSFYELLNTKRVFSVLKNVLEGYHGESFTTEEFNRTELLLRLTYALKKYSLKSV